MLLALVIEKGATSQGMMLVSGRWKNQRKDFLDPPEVAQSYRLLTSRP
jgi:hypothetical protein